MTVRLLYDILVMYPVSWFIVPVTAEIVNLKELNSQRKASRPKRPKSPDNDHSSWTLLTNHGHVIVLLGLNPELTIRDLALNIGITERAVQRILADLQRDGFIQVDKNGRRNSYRVDMTKHFRHPIEEECQIRSLISAVKQSQTNDRD